MDVGLSQEATARRAERKQTRTKDEIDNEIRDEEFGIEELDEPGVEECDEDGDAPIYNPKNLPLGWDGRPIPYWLYKLHGLDVAFTCEICGSFPCIESIYSPQLSKELESFYQAENHHREPHVLRASRVRAALQRVAPLARHALPPHPQHEALPRSSFHTHTHTKRTPRLLV